METDFLNTRKSRNDSEIREDNITELNATLSLEPLPDDSESYIWIPLLVLFGILILSAIVYLMARYPRRMKTICVKSEYITRFKENNDSTAALLKSDEYNDPKESLLNGKFQIENRFQSYMSNGMKASEDFIV